MFAPAHLFEAVLNIYRGILNILHITVKNNYNVYDLQEVLTAHVPQNSTQRKKDPL